MFRITDVVLDAGKTLGSKLWLVEVAPVFEYRDNRRTDTVSGYRYIVALPEKGLEKLSVKIDGKQLMESPNGYVEVTFTGLELYIYWAQGDYRLGARASGVQAVNANK